MALDYPRFVRLSSVPKSVMEPVWTALPEFDAGRGKDIAAPKRRFWNLLAGILRFQLLPLSFEFSAVHHDFALSRGPCANAAAARAAFEVSVGFGLRQFRDIAHDTNLAFKVRPIEDQCAARIFSQLMAFATVVIGEENESAFVHAFQQNDARRRTTFFIGGGESHRIDVRRFRAKEGEEGFVNRDDEFANATAGPRASGLLEPSPELSEWIRFQIDATKAGEVVFSAQIGDGHRSRRNFRAKRFKHQA